MAYQKDQRKTVKESPGKKSVTQAWATCPMLCPQRTDTQVLKVQGKYYTKEPNQVTKQK